MTSEQNHLPTCIQFTSRNNTARQQTMTMVVVVLSNRRDVMLRSLYRQGKEIIKRPPRIGCLSSSSSSSSLLSSFSTTTTTTTPPPPPTTTTTTTTTKNLSAFVDNLLSNVADEYFATSSFVNKDEATPMMTVQKNSSSSSLQPNQPQYYHHHHHHYLHHHHHQQQQQHPKKQLLHTVAFSGGVDSSLVAFLLHTVVANQNATNAAVVTDHRIVPTNRSGSSSNSSSSNSTTTSTTTTTTTIPLYDDQDQYHQQQYQYPQHTVRAVLGVSAAVSAEQRHQAYRVANHIGIHFREVTTTEGDMPLYVENNGHACYACKTNLYRTLQSIYQCEYDDDYSVSLQYQEQQQQQQAPPKSNFPPQQQYYYHELYNGTNKDDLQDPTRVGLVAATEFHVHSPLRGLDKATIRTVARYVGLPNADAAAAPCLRSRLQWGVPAVPDHLARIERAERFVRAQLQHHVLDRTTTATTTTDPTTTATTTIMDAINLRVRFLARQRARIEIDATYMAALQDQWRRNTVAWDQAFLRDLNFTAYDLAVFRTGSVAATEKSTSSSAS